MKSILVNIQGKVQGVGFRAFVEHHALKIGIKGYVKNCIDGSVEAEFQGTEEQLKQIIIICEKGPISSNVIKITKVTVPNKDYTSFEVIF